ncbi:hypothetical protein AB1Y20_018720 [Prymnesium parvum]|uniref:Amidohydrolase 3 domain-containing protein n=1 Tax=Prymnesium parvum TaxID=97485 RepID=A0AB34JS28_PRYPA
MRTLFHNGRIWQWSPAAFSGPAAMLSAADRREARAPPADWMLVDGGVVAAVGVGAPPLAAAPHSVDLRGRLVLPGLHDAHIHCYSLGAASALLQLAGCASIAALRALVDAHARAHPQLAWVVGVGWDQTLWGGAFPDRHALDGVEGLHGRPCWLWRACCHVGVANTAALEAAGISAASAGELGADGEPSGLLKEAETEMVRPFLGEARPEARRATLADAAWACASVGLTAVHSHEFGDGWSAAEAWEAYGAMERQGALPLRVFVTPSADEEGKPPPTRAAGAPPPLLSCHRAKLFADGSLGAETAAMRTAYLRRPEGGGEEEGEAGGEGGGGGEEEGGEPNFGQLAYPAAELRARVLAAAAEGYRLEVHAIGDAAAAAALDAFDALPRGARPLLTHCQLLGADLLGRMAARGVIANVQPSFVPSDARLVRRLLPRRLHAAAYCWRSLLAAGVVCAGGSDAPVELPSPLLGMHDAIARAERPEGAPPAARDAAAVFLPEERLPFEAALWMYTLGAAYAAGEEESLGSLSGGRAADFVVLSEDVSEGDSAAALLRCQVDETWVGGVRRFVRGADGAADASRAPSDPLAAGRNGPTRAPVAVGAAGCACCAGRGFDLRRARNAKRRPRDDPEAGRDTPADRQ